MSISERLVISRDPKSQNLQTQHDGHVWLM